MMSGVMKNSPLHFARFEFKYILATRLADEIEQELQHFLQYDPFVMERKHHRYQVRSLYFDDPVYSAFYDKVDGLHSRNKYRLRTYSLVNSSTIPLFLESKGRHNNLVYKHRTPVMRGDLSWSDLSRQDLIQAILQQGESSQVLEQFSYDCLRRRLSAVALIDYQRRPYISKFDTNFRLTFDSQLQVTQTNRLFPSAAVSRSLQVLPGYVILELKFRHHLPAWFHAIIQAYELQRVSISKICAGMKCLGLADDD